MVRLSLRVSGFLLATIRTRQSPRPRLGVDTGAADAAQAEIGHDADDRKSQ